MRLVIVADRRLLRPEELDREIALPAERKKSRDQRGDRYDEKELPVLQPVTSHRSRSRVTPCQAGRRRSSIPGPRYSHSSGP
jgi:hypothetical protein